MIYITLLKFFIHFSTQVFDFSFFEYINLDVLFNDYNTFRSPWLYPDFIFYRTKQGQKFKADCDYVHKIAEDIIDKRRRELVSI